MNKVIQTADAPQAIGTYSQAVQAGSLLFVSGQIGLEPASGKMVDGGFRAQAKQVFANLKAVINAADAHLSQVVKLTIYLHDFNDFADLNDEMAKWFNLPYPARAAVQVSRLPKDALIEIEAIVNME